MARPGKLNAMKVAAIVRKAKPGYTGDGGGLYLQISRYGTPSWVFRYRVDARLREMGLGPLDTVKLAEARDEALKCRQMRREVPPRDPIEARRAVRTAARIERAKATTFRQCAERYIEAHKAEWRSEKSLKAWKGTLGMYAYPIIGDLPVRDIDTALVMTVLGPVWSKAPETANRLRGRIEAVLGWATTSKFRDGDNPAQWRGHLENLLAKPAKAKEAKRQAEGRGAHHPALPYAEIGGFMAALRQQEGVSARALEFAILTAARTGEILGARWDEFDDPASPTLWTIPAERTKAGKEHRVPLSGAAAAIIKNMAAIRSGEFVFPGASAGRPLSNMALLMALRRMKRDDLTAHGFRSTFRDWAAERTGFPAEVAEMALAHAVGDRVEAAYRRGDLFQKRRQLMEAWAKFCAAPSTADGRKVIAMRGAA